LRRKEMGYDEKYPPTHSPKEQPFFNFTKFHGSPLRGPSRRNPMKTYKTSDIYVAALLRTAGLKFLGVIKNGGRGVFEFEDSPEREKLILDFFNGQVVQNIRQYVDHWMSFKRLVERL
jgi:hypothetical protein